MESTHIAHVLKADEWCLGTEPPTKGMVNRGHQELYVDIYEAGTNLHDGSVSTPVDREQFLLKPEITLEPSVLSNFGRRALEAHER